MKKVCNSYNLGLDHSTQYKKANQAAYSTVYLASTNFSRRGFATLNSSYQEDQRRLCNFLECFS